jgi:hypothetical protein
MFASEAANEFLAAVDSLPAIPTRTLYVNEAERKWFTKKGYDALPRNVQSSFRSIQVNEERYYVGTQQTPLIHARMLDIANLYGHSTMSGARAMDYGNSAIGAARLMAASGGSVFAVYTDPKLAALYQTSGDTGAITGMNSRQGNLTVVTGDFPADAATKAAVGSGYDLIFSRDVFTTSRGAAANDPNAAQRLSGFAQAMKPGALYVIYNVARPSSRDARTTEGDAKISFTLDELQAAGFKVIVYNQNDDGAIRQMGQLLGWDKQIGALERNLFARYSVLQK